MSELSNLYDRKVVTERVIAHHQEELAQIMAQIEEIAKERLAQARELAGKPLTGTVTAIIDGIEVKQEIPKNVKWDQDVLQRLWNRITANGEDPEDYISAKTKYSVAEKKYSSFTPAIQKTFDEARTISAGKPKIMLKEMSQ